MTAAVRGSTKRHARPQSPTRSYDAFISYSQRTDYDIAVALQNGLRRLARPWHRRPALAVFRDETLSNSPNLKHELETALTNSRYLVVLASPAAAQSPWVRAEIEFFLAKPPDPPEVPQRDRILLAVTDGAVLWEGDRRFTESSTAIPAPLQGVFDEVPKYTDLRPYRGRTDLSLAHPEFRRDVADIAAPIHGKHEGQLVLDDDAKQFRIAKALRWTAVTSLAILTVAALVASVIAVSSREEANDQRDEAEAQRDEAEAQRAVAEGQTERAVAAEADAVAKAAESRSGELAAQALRLTATDPELAALLAVESLYPNGAVDELRSPSAVNAVGVTARALLTRSFVRIGRLRDSTRHEVVASVGQFVATVGPSEDGACWPEFDEGVGLPAPIEWWDRTTGERLASPPPDVGLPPFVNTDWGVLRIDDARQATPLIGFDGCARLPVSGEIAVNVGSGPIPNDGDVPDGSLPLGGPAVYDEASGLLFALDLPSGQYVTIEPLTGAVISRTERPADVNGWRDVAVIEGLGDRLVIVTTSGGELFVVGLRTGGELVQTEQYRGGELATVGNRVFYGSTVADVDLQSGTGVIPTDLPGVTTEGVADARFSEDGRFLALSDATCLCRTEVWDLSAELPIEIGSIPSSTISSTHWMGDDLALTTARGVEFYSYRPPQIRQSWYSTVSADGSTAVTVTYDEQPALIVHGPSESTVERRRLDVASEDYVHALSADGRLVALGGSTMRVVDLETGEVLFVDDNPSSTAAFAPLGDRMAVSQYEAAAADRGPRGGSLRVFDTNTWEQVAASTAGVDSLGLYGLTWISGTEMTQRGPNDEVHLFRVVEDVIEVLGIVDGASELWSSVDRELQVVADGMGFVRLLVGPGSDGAEGTELSSFEASTAAITAAAISPDNERLVTASERSITMWDISDPREPQRVEALDALPFVDAIAGATSWVSGVWFRDGGAGLVISMNSSVLDLPDFDPVRVCAESGAGAIDAAEKFLGEMSACRRVPALQR